MTIGGAGSLIEADASLDPMLGRLTESSSPTGCVAGGLMSLLRGSMRGCGRGLEWSHSVPHKGPAKLHVLLLIPPSCPALIDVFEPGVIILLATRIFPYLPLVLVDETT